MSRARARACRRFLRVSRSAYFLSSSGLTGLTSSFRDLTSRGGGALWNAAARFLCASNFAGPPGHSARVFSDAGEMHCDAESDALSVAARALGAANSDTTKTDQIKHALLELIHYL